MVKGYKNLQARAVKSEQALRAASDRIAKMETFFQQVLARQTNQPQKQDEEDALPPEFWNAPEKHLPAFVRTVAKQVAEQLYSERVGPIAGDVGRMRTNAEIDAFINSNKDITPEDEAAMVQVLKSDESIRNSPNRLEIAYAVVQRRKALAGKPRAAAAAAVADAKSAASMGGKRSSLAPRSEGDEFDAVLRNAEASKNLHRLGRK